MSGANDLFYEPEPEPIHNPLCSMELAAPELSRAITIDSNLEGASLMDLEEVNIEKRPQRLFRRHTIPFSSIDSPLEDASPVDPGESRRRLLRRHTITSSQYGRYRSVEIKVDKSSPSFKNDMRFVCAILRIPQEMRRLILAGCTVCSPELRCTVCSPDLYSKDRSEYGHEFVFIRKLDTQCVFCGVLQQVYSSLIEKVQAYDFVEIIYPKSKRFHHLQVSFGSFGDEINATQVQLYSPGPYDSWNPFPVSPFEICLDPLSLQMVKKIQRWIETCTKHHEECMNAVVNESFVPKRLIRLEGNCRLESPESPVQYAALSYCWGVMEQSPTTTSNISLRFDNIHYQDLPQTLQDAIDMARALGLHYLWIDSICIVQDDKEDWAEQASKMANIYSRAHVVLAATAGSSASEGFLSHRSRFKQILSFVDPEHPITVNARVVDSHKWSLDNFSLKDQPLSKRGWTFQERALARRTVHFMPNEVLFECRSSFGCECGFFHQGQDLSYESSLAWVLDLKGLRSGPASDRDFARRWTSILIEFTQRSLTFPDDALPALSGVAQSMLPLRPGNYFAGIWERGIAFLLAWTHVELRERFVKGITDGEKKDLQPRPTFSWATTHGPVFWPELFRGNLDEYHQICTLVSGENVPLAGDIYGQVENVFIQMNGQAMDGWCLLYYANHNFEDPDSWDKLTVFLDTMSLFPDRSWSDSGWQDSYEGFDTACDWDSVLCFGLYVYRDRKLVTMLLLQVLPENDSFRRIGLVEKFPLQLFNRLSIERTVTIV